MKCPDCDHNNRTGVLVCEMCGEDLYDALLDNVATSKLSTDIARELNLHDSPSSSNPIVMYIAKVEAPISINRLNNLMIGRIDPATGKPADIDLTEYEAQNNGVSRRHARIDARGKTPMIMDLGSFNGTFVNGQRLTPQQPHPLTSGDEVVLGKLTTRVYFK